MTIAPDKCTCLHGYGLLTQFSHGLIIDLLSRWSLVPHVVKFKTDRFFRAQGRGTRFAITISAQPWPMVRPLGG